MNNKDNQESDASWLLNIPDELKLQVFKNLSPKDLISVSETCSQLNGLIQQAMDWAHSGPQWDKKIPDLESEQMSLAQHSENH